MTDRALMNQTAIVGVGDTDYFALYRNLDPERTREELAIQVLHQALDDAGLRLDQIDGLITTGTNFYPDLCYRTGLRDVRFINEYTHAGRMCATALGQAAMAVHHGLANYVALVHSLNSRSARVTYGAGLKVDLYDNVFGMASPGALYALGFNRYLHLYGGRAEQLGAIAIAIRKHAARNPRAIMQTPITLEDYLNSRYIARPLHLFDYCLVNDGAVCYIVTSVERARDLKQRPVLITGIAGQATLREWYVAEDFWYSAAQRMAADLFGPTGLTVRDIDAVQVYDNFSVSVLWGLEGFGFCGQGEGLDWIQNGRIELGGELPVNTSGGMLSEAYLQGWNAHAEAVRQLRGQAGPRQVPNAEHILYWCLSAVPGATLLTRG